MFRCSRRAVWASAAATVLAVLAGSAPASSLAESGTLVTGHPDLIAAQAISPKQVLACFDQILSTPFTFTDANFYLQGYTEDRKTGAATGLTLSSTTASGGGFCVVALYTGPGDVRTYSRVVALAGAVTAMVPGGSGVGSVQGAVPILGSAFPSGPGGVLRPQLTGATVGSAGVVYTFDEALTAAPAAGKFGFYAGSDSTFHPGTSIAFSPGMTVNIGFSTSDLALLAQATRFVAAEGAVTDAGGLTNPIGVIGGATKLLDLAPTTGRLAAAGGLTYHFDFNAAIPGAAVACQGAFALYDAGGVRYSPASGGPVTISADRKSVSLTFAADTPGGDPAQITLATVAADGIDGAACGAGSPTPLNSDGAAGLPGVADKAPSTSGPDLVGFTINKTTGFASFQFDAPVAGITPASFHLVSRSGSLTSPPSQQISCLLSNGPAPVFGIGPANQVNVNFSTPACLLLNLLLPGPADVTAARNAVGVTVDEGAVTDAASGVVNPVGSLGLLGATSGPSGPTTPPASPIPPGATTPPTLKPVVANACKRVVMIHLLTSVSRNVRSATATINGKKATVSKSRTLTVSFAKYPGVKSIVVKIKGKLKNHHSFSLTRRYTNKC